MRTRVIFYLLRQYLMKEDVSIGKVCGMVVLWWLWPVIAVEMLLKSEPITIESNRSSVKR